MGIETPPMNVAFFRLLAAAAAGAALLSSSAEMVAQSWLQTSAPITNWYAVASSADGGKLVAVGRGDYSGAISDHTAGPIYTSTDSGVTWTQTSAPIAMWCAVASSADGTTLIAGTGPFYPGGLVYISTNSGATWESASIPSSTWTSVACSADARVLVAAGAVVAGETYGSSLPSR